MNRAAVSVGIGIAVFLLWYFVAIEFIWLKDGLTIAMGVSLALNASLLFWIASARRSIRGTTDRVSSNQ